MKTKKIFPLLILFILLCTGAVLVSELSKEETQLVKRLRVFHKAADDYVQDKKMWPQCPFDEKSDSKKFADWWKTALKPYGVEGEMWIWDERNEAISFQPAKMKPHNFEPYRNHLAWFRTTFTIGDPGKYFAVFPDGSVREVTEDGGLIEVKAESEKSRSETAATEK